MKLVFKLCIHLNEYEHAMFSAQARAECRTISGLIKYTTLQYCKAYPSKVKQAEAINPKEVFVKYVAPDEVFHNL